MRRKSEGENERVKDRRKQRAGSVLSFFPSTPLSSLFPARRTSLFVSTKSPIIPTSTYLGVEGGREEGREGGRVQYASLFVKNEKNTQGVT